jgi:hypothetical protein
MSGLVEKYPKKNPADAAASAGAMGVLRAAAEEEYKAYNTAAHAKFQLWFRTSDASQHANTSMPYSYLNHMITDGSGFVISMHFSTPVISVTIQGRNLADLWRKLLEHEVEWVMEFDPRKWATPPEDAPCITGIEIVRKPLPEVEEARLPGEKKAASSSGSRH